jgi:hypothetical protein
LQPLAILFGAAFTAASAYSLGVILLRNSSSDPGVRFVSGASLLSLLIFAAAAAGFVYPATVLAIGAVAILVARAAWRLPARPRWTNWWLLFLPFFVLYFFNSMAPEISFDGSRYHLGLVGRYLREHGFHPITDNFYAALPQGVEMLYLFAYSFGRHSAAAMVHFVFLLALSWQVYAWARRCGWPLAGRCAALLVFASPMLGVDGSSAYNDVAVAAIAFTLFHTLDLWSESRDPRLLIAAGLLAGFACAAKYTAFLAVPYAVAFVVLKTRMVRPAAAVVLCASIPLIPWLVKNYLWFWNPLSPFFNHWFQNPYVTTSFETEYRSTLATFGTYRSWQIPFQVTTLGSMSGLLGPVFLLAPISLLSLRRVEGRRLLLAATLFGVPFFLNASTRFLIPAVPFLALSMCLVLSTTPRVLIALVVAHALLSWPDVVRRYVRPDAWRLAKVPFREALRIKPELGFLESNLPYYGITRRIEELTPPGATIFTDTSLPEAYTSRRILVSYQSASGIVSRRIWFSGFVPEHAPVWRARFAFPPRTLGGFRLVQETGSSPNQWTLHELRAYDGGHELPRTSWRVTPQPFPWGIEAALDGRPASLWMCGERLRPGQSIRVEFAGPQRADAGVMEMAPDHLEAQYVLEAAEFRVKPEYEQLPTPPNLRRLAAEELKRRGIDYLLAFDGQFGAGDLRDRAADWGIRQITQYKGATLYQLP